MFKKIAEDLGMELRTDYSGRGMCGKTCIGFVHGTTNTEAAMEIAFYVAKNFPYCDLINDFKNVRTDSMGRESIIYFPSIQVEDYED